MMGIERFHSVISEWQRISEVGPYVTLSRKNVGVDVDPARDVVFLTRAELHSRSAVLRCPEPSVKQAVDFHHRAARGVESGFHRALHHDGKFPDWGLKRNSRVRSGGILLDGEDHFAGEMFGNGFEKGFLMRADEGLPEDDAVNFQGHLPNGSCTRAT